MAKKKVVKKVNIVIDENDPFIDGDILAKEILRVSRGFEQLNNSRLKAETAVILLHEATKVGKPAIRRILQAAPHLGKKFLKK